MKKLLIQELHAYLMEDGEIIICEMITDEGLYWTSSHGEGVVRSDLRPFVIGIDLGFVDENLDLVISA